MKPQRSKKTTIQFYSALLLYFFTACGLSTNVKDHSFGEQCTHCHGERLQGIHNTRHYCGQCHEITRLPSDRVSDPVKKEIINSEPHVHKTSNMFGGTPSCFNCHRKKDF